MPNVYRAEMGEPPMDIDGGSAPAPTRKKAEPKSSGIYRAEMGQPPKDIDGGSAPAPTRRKPVDESVRHYKGMANVTKQK